MIEVSEEDLNEVLESFKSLVKEDRYTISSGHNRLKNDEFIAEYMLTKKQIKSILLELTAKDCIDIHHKDKGKIVYEFIKEYNIKLKDNDNMEKVYIKFMICLVKCQKHVLVISFMIKNKF